MARKSERFAKKSQKYKPTEVKVGDKYVNPKSGISYEVTGQKVEKDKKTGVTTRILKIKTNYEPKPDIALPDSLFITDDLVKVERKKKVGRLTKKQRSKK